MTLVKLHKTVGVKVGQVQVGGGAPIVVQSMTMTDTADVRATAEQCIELAAAGSEMVRVTVNLPEAAAAVPEIKRRMLEAGCTAPVGALAEVVDSGEGVVELSLRAFAGSLDATVDLRRSIVGPVEQAEQLGRELAAVLLADGASEISTSIAQPPPPGPPPDPGGASGDDVPLAVPAAEQPSASHPDRPTPERAS